MINYIIITSERSLVIGEERTHKLKSSENMLGSGAIGENNAGNQPY